MDWILELDPNQKMPRLAVKLTVADENTWLSPLRPEIDEIGKSLHR